jgi:hypothetical protein
LSSSSIVVLASIASAAISECVMHNTPMFGRNMFCRVKGWAFWKGKRLSYYVRYDTPFPVCLGSAFSSFSMV